MDKIQVKPLEKAKEIRDKKSKRIHLVVTESEHQQILAYSSEFKTVSDYI
jgi:heat shock protein HspQ